MADHHVGHFAEHAFGERRSCLHDALAVALVAGSLEPTLMPRVRAEVVTEGPARGQTLCDLRVMHLGFPEQPDARCEVLLECDPAVVEDIIDRIAACGETWWEERP